MTATELIDAYHTDFAVELGEGALGIVLVERNPGAFVFVERVVAGGLAETAGAQRGDQVVGVNGEDVRHVGFDDVLGRLKLAPRPVTVSLRRAVAPEQANKIR